MRHIPATLSAKKCFPRRSPFRRIGIPGFRQGLTPLSRTAHQDQEAWAWRSPTSLCLMRRPWTKEFAIPLIRVLGQEVICSSRLGRKLLIWWREEKRMSESGNGLVLLRTWRLSYWGSRCTSFSCIRAESAKRCTNASVTRSSANRLVPPTLRRTGILTENVSNKRYQRWSSFSRNHTTHYHCQGTPRRFVVRSTTSFEMRK